MHARTLPRHARTGQQALGWRKPRPGEDGLQPIWPILGGADDDVDDDDQDDDQDDDAKKSGKDDSDKDTGDDGKDWKSEAEKWKSHARKWQERAKANSEAAKERDELKRNGMSEVEKKTAEAVAAARAEERVRAGERVARSAFMAAAKGRLANPKEVVEDINLRRYVDEDGEVDDEAIAKLVDKLAPASGTDDGDEDDQDERDTRRRRRAGSGYQGARNGSGRSKSKRGSVNGDELFAELMGRKPRTTSQT